MKRLVRGTVFSSWFSPLIPRRMARLVFDIETSALPPENFDEAQRNIFSARRKITDEPARTPPRRNPPPVQSLAFYRHVVCVAMLKPKPSADRSSTPPMITIPNPAKPALSNSSLCGRGGTLTAFWDVAAITRPSSLSTDAASTSRSLYLRSALLNVPSPAKTGSAIVYATEPHCDLAEQFTFYGVSGREGAARRFNLDFYCKAFASNRRKATASPAWTSITSWPPAEYRKIAEYCLRDVQATGPYQIGRNASPDTKLNAELKRHHPESGIRARLLALKEESARFRKIAPSNPASPFLTPASDATLRRSLVKQLAQSTPHLVLTCGFAAGWTRR